MSAIMLIIIPIFFLSYFLAGGFVSPFPQKAVTPSGRPQVIASQPTIGAGKQLQINTFKFSSPLPPSPPPPPSQAPQICLADTNRSTRPGCQCPSNESFGVMCNIGQVTAPYAYHPPSSSPVYPTLPVSITCPDQGIPCAYFNGNPSIQAAWGCRANSCIYLKTFASGGAWSGNPNYPKYETQCGNESICFGKPVIYLYPDRIMQVAVKLDIPGIITESIPHYPKEGWQNITAYPGGLFNYQGKIYDELYYESSVNKNFVPQEGFVLSTKTLPTDIDNILIKMGLISRERREFLDYWLPRLTALDQPYIFMGFLKPEQKEIVDKVIVSPTPDTTIAFLAYFKGLSSPVWYPKPQMPTVPARTGFTMVEWGGTIDQ